MCKPFTLLQYLCSSVGESGVSLQTDDLSSLGRKEHGFSVCLFFVSASVQVCST